MSEHISKVFQPKRVEKEWGYELWLANNSRQDYCGKILHVTEGYRGSMHWHLKKHETFYILKGEMQLDLLNTEKGTVYTEHLKEGDCYEIPVGQPHQIIAKGDLDIIESSTYHMDSDSFRAWRGAPDVQRED